MNKVEIFVFDEYTGKYVNVHLYDDETVTLNSAIKDYKQLDKAISDYTQNFNIPCSSRNNNLFRHFYSPKIVDVYDARYKRKAIMKVNGEDFREGEISFLNASVINGIPSSYNIVFYSNLSVVSTLLGADKLDSLPKLSDLNHNYTIDVVRDLVEKGAFRRKGYKYSDIWLESGYSLSLSNGAIAETFGEWGLKEQFSLNVTTLADSGTRVRVRTGWYEINGRDANEDKVVVKFECKTDNANNRFNVRTPARSLANVQNFDIPQAELSNTVANVWQKHELEIDLSTLNLTDISGLRAEFLLGYDLGLFTFRNISFVLETDADDSVDKYYVEDDLRSFRTGSPDLIYPMISSVNRYYYNSLGTTLPIDKTRNIRCTSLPATRYKGIYWKDLKPAVRNEFIFKAIEERYNVEFRGSLFEYGSPLMDSYLFFQRESGFNDKTLKFKRGVILRETPKEIYLNSQSPKDWFYYDYQANYTITGTGSYSVKVSDTNTGYVYYEKKKIDDVITSFSAEIKPLQGSSSYVSNLKIEFYDISENITAIDLVDEKLISSEYKSGIYVPAETTSYGASNLPISVLADMQSLLSPKMTIKQYLQSVFKLYNIVAEVEGNVINCYPYNEYMLDKEYNTYDITDYTEENKIEVKKVEVFSELKLEHKPAKTVFNIKSNNATGEVFGQEYFKSEGERAFDGKSLKVKTDFSVCIYENFANEGGGVNTDLNWGYMTTEDGGATKADNLIFYTESVDVSSLESRLTNVNSEDVDSDSYSDDTPPPTLNRMFRPQNYKDFVDERYSLAFGSEFTSNGLVEISESLYNIYYKDYINNIYTRNAKVMKLDCFLPSFLLTKIKMNDRIVFNNNRFIVNSMKSNLRTGKVTFELMTDTFIKSSDFEGGGFSDGFSDGFKI